MGMVTSYSGVSLWAEEADKDSWSSWRAVTFPPWPDPQRCPPKAYWPSLLSLPVVLLDFAAANGELGWLTHPYGKGVSLRGRAGAWEWGH